MYPTLTNIDFHEQMHSVKALNCCETFVEQNRQVRLLFYSISNSILVTIKILSILTDMSEQNNTNPDQTMEH